MSLSSSAARELAFTRALASGLCHDAGLQVEPNENGNWRFEPERNTIVVPTADLEHRGARYCAGVIAHEAGHRLISRYQDFAGRADDAASRTILNCCEDARVEHYMGERYPGVRAWLDELVQSLLTRETVPPSVFQQVNAATAAAPRFESQPPWPNVPQAEHAARVLQATHDGRMRYMREIPPVAPRMTTSHANTARAWAELVGPRLAAAARHRLSTADDAVVVLSAARALRIFESELLTPLIGAIDIDVSRVYAWLHAGEISRGHADFLAHVYQPHDLVNVMIRAWSSVPAEPGEDPELRGFARQIVMRYLFGDPNASDGPSGREIKGSDPWWYSLVEGLEQRREPIEYRKVAARLEAQTSLTREQLLRMFPPRRKGRRSGWFISGPRVDLRRAMAAQADPHGATQLWVRTAVPKAADASVLLLVDLSGSMRSRKIEAAMECVVLLCEALEGLDVAVGIAGFQDQLIWIREIGEPLDHRVVDRIEQMPLEVWGVRPEGHNHPDHNDDGPCLLEAAAALARYPSAWRVLIVISDGHPAGLRSTPEDLHEAVARLRARGSPDVLVGVGVGPGTEHVADYYPIHAAEVPVEDLANRLAALLTYAVRKKGVSRR